MSKILGIEIRTDYLIYRKSNNGYKITFTKLIWLSPFSVLPHCKLNILFHGRKKGAEILLSAFENRIRSCTLVCHGLQ